MSGARRRRSICRLGLAALAISAVAPAAASAATPPRPSAIVLVTVDTLRADRVSFGGYALPTTPFLDRLASEGVIFDRAYATSSWTPPTMASIFTGVPPMTHGVVSGEITESKALRQPVLPESLLTLAELARVLAFRTLGVASNRHLTVELGFAQGFDRFFDPPSFLSGEVVNEQARALLAQEYGAGWKQAWRSRPLFLWLHYFDPHDPYLPDPAWIQRHAPGAQDRGPLSPARLVMRDLKRRFPEPDAALAAAIRPFYDSEVHRTDRVFAALWNELAPDGNVLLILTADHGEEIVDHGKLGHSQSLYEELVRVPLLFWWPRGLPAGVRVDQPVSVLDLLPTLHDLLGQPVPPSLAGRSLAPLWRGKVAGEPASDPAASPARPVFLELQAPKPSRWAIIDGYRKLILDPTTPATLSIPAASTAPVVELYDLRSDPGETINLAARQPVEVERLRGELRSWARQHPLAPDQKTRDRKDEALRKELEALGYLGN